MANVLDHRVSLPVAVHSGVAAGREAITSQLVIAPIAKPTAVQVANSHGKSTDALALVRSHASVASSDLSTGRMRNQMLSDLYIM